jgi:hypothetical protein
MAIKVGDIVKSIGNDNDTQYKVLTIRDNKVNVIALETGYVYAGYELSLFYKVN